MPAIGEHVPEAFAPPLLRRRRPIARFRRTSGRQPVVAPRADRRGHEQPRRRSSSLTGITRRRQVVHLGRARSANPATQSGPDDDERGARAERVSIGPIPEHADRGVPLELIAELLGHTSTQLLDQTYRRRRHRAVTAALDVMGGCSDRRPHPEVLHCQGPASHPQASGRTPTRDGLHSGQCQPM